MKTLGQIAYEAAVWVPDGWGGDMPNMELGAKAGEWDALSEKARNYWESAGKAVAEVTRKREIERMMTFIPLSKCCAAPMNVCQTNSPTKYYLCAECGDACDARI